MSLDNGEVDFAFKYEIFWGECTTVKVLVTIDII